MNKLAIIDIDGLFYQSCKETLELSIESFKERLNNLFEKTECDYWCGFVTKGKCFRYSISDEYKANRKDKPKPRYLSALREWAIEEYNLNVCDLWEADDYVAWLARKTFMYYEMTTDEGNLQKSITFEEAYKNDLKFHKDFPQYEMDKDWRNVEAIICSHDKDVLKSIPGKHFNYSYKLTEKDNPDSLIKGWWVETANVDSNKFKWVQLLMGELSPLFI